MAIPTTNFPQVRTVTGLVRSLLGDDAIAPGYPFQPISLVVGAGGLCVAQFAIAPGFIPGDTLLLANWTPANVNGSGLTVQTVNGNQITWTNPASVTTGTATGGTIQGYGTGTKYTDTILMPFVNSAYRSLQRALKATGSTEFKESQAFVTIPGITFAEPSTQVVLAYEGVSISSDADPAPTFIDPVITSQLPADLLSPLEIWERQTGSQNNFSPVVDLTNDGGLPSRAQGQFLGVFEWAGDELVFIGATQDQDIKIRYQRSLPAVANGQSNLLVLNSEDFHAYAVATLCDASRGGRQTPTWTQIAEDAKEKLVNAATRQQQYVSRRPRGFSSRRGPRSVTFY